MKTPKLQLLVVYAIVVILSLLLWLGLLFFGYMDDDWSSPPTDERSVPAAETY
jgi:hypothetical protein